MKQGEVSSNMNKVFLILMAAIFGEASTNTQTNYSDLNCTVVEGGVIHQEAYIGWPYVINCGLFSTTSYYTLYDVYNNNYDTFDVDNEDAIFCLMYNMSDNSLLLNQTTNYEDFGAFPEHGLFLDDIKKDEAYQFKIHIFIPSIEGCFALVVNVTPIPFHQITCQRYLESSPVLSSTSTQVGNFKTLRCKVPIDEYPKIHTRKGMGNVTINWLRNCSDFSSISNDVKTETLIIDHVNFTHAGIYTCAYTYNGMTRFLKRSPVCVKYRATTNQHTVKCQKDVYANIGNDATLKCVVRLGAGESSLENFRIYWKKKGSLQEKKCKVLSKISIKQRRACSFDFEDGCLLHEASEAEQELTQEIIEVNLVLKNVTSSDYGTYVIIATKDLKIATDDNDTVTLSPDPIPCLLGKAQIAGICIGIIGLSTILVVILLWRNLQVRVYYKRYFGRKQGDGREYGAYLTYHFSREIDRFAQDDTERCIRSTCDELRRLGYKIYDEHQHFSTGMKTKTLQDSIEKSHRVVVILTHQYIKDDWSMRNLQEAFQKMIDFKTKIIFIMVPGVEEYLKQHAQTDDACRMIKAAIRLNYAIAWSKEKNFNKKIFKLRIEDAMPKLSSKIVTSSSENRSSLDLPAILYKDLYDTKF